MKRVISLCVIVTAVILTACKKEILSRPVEFNTTTYEALGEYDSEGRPGYLMTPDVISSEMKAFINATLVEKADLRVSHPELLSSDAIADIAISESSDVFITYVSQITTSTNALAFYTYPTSNPPSTPDDITKITYFFPSAGTGTKLRAGDKVKLGNFQTGTSIGFVLMKNAWDPITGGLNNKVVHFCSNDILNPEIDPNLKKHAVLIDYPSESKTLIGFENTDRTTDASDHDFNDIVIYATVKMPQ